MVSIHAPVWGATNRIAMSLTNKSFQSTHPCGVRHPIKRRHSGMVSVSIHAPVWGATKLIHLLIIQVCVSIHAPVWGATSVVHGHYRRRCFNPRTRVGCDTCPTSQILCRVCFNPRTRVGCDWRFLRFRRYLRSFNPRTRVGCDGVKNLDRIRKGVSIHAPVWGATSIPVRGNAGGWFQSTHPCGVRPSHL